MTLWGGLSASVDKFCIQTSLDTEFVDVGGLFCEVTQCCLLHVVLLCNYVVNLKLI